MNRTEDPAAKLARQLLAAGIAFQEPEIIEGYYNSMKGIFIAGFASPDPLSGLYLDLNALPTQPIDLKAVFIKWMIQINIPRIKAGQEPLMPLSAAMKCPLWKVISPPLRRLNMTREGLFGKPSVTTLNKKKVPGRINKK